MTLGQFVLLALVVGAAIVIFGQKSDDPDSMLKKMAQAILAAVAVAGAVATDLLSNLSGLF